MNKRDRYGMIGWFIVAILFGILSEAVMLGREWYQSKRYHFPIETDDVRRYSWVILVGCVIHYLFVLFR